MQTERYLLVIRRILILAILYSCCRGLFLIFNYDVFQEAGLFDIVLAFVYGLRFDLSIIFSSNLPFIVFSLLPFSFMDSPVAKRILKTLYLLVNVPLLFMNLADTEYFKFTLKRTGYDVMGIAGDVQQQSVQLALHYWYIPLLTVLMGWSLYKLYDRKAETTKRIPLWVSGVILVISVACSVLIIRGGLQYKPLKPDHAFVQSPNVLGNLVLNTPYNFFTTMNFPRVENSTYYSSDSQVREQLPHAVSTLERLPAGTNVVVIILESFSREYMGTTGKKNTYTPFLDSLASAGVFFDHHFANGKRSIEAVPSIFASVPALMEEPYITGVYQGNELHGIAEQLGRHGYHTAFFHGGRNGTMGFDKFALNAGFREYYGLKEYPDQEKDFDGTWGIYDEPYLQYFCRKLSSFKAPFMAGVFTLSSHQPYSVPVQYKGVFPKGTLEIHESIGYADHALKKFFESASSAGWYQNTLFVITADHTQGLSTKEYQNVIGEYRVPMILFHPGKKIKVDTSRVSQHLDIMPTVLDYVGIRNERPVLFGESLLDSSEGRALFYNNKTYVYYKKEYFLEFDQHSSRLYRSSDWNKTNEITDQGMLKEQYEQELKAYIQYYNNGLNNNSWYRFGIH